MEISENFYIKIMLYVLGKQVIIYCNYLKKIFLVSLLKWS